MATLSEKIIAVNTLGRNNLAEKGVELGENSTTFDIMSAIAEISGGGGTEEIETLIDNSGVLEDTDGTVTEKVEELINEADVFKSVTGGGGLLFSGATSFPSKAVVNLPNTTSVYKAFASWETSPIPIVEELTVNAPNINVSDKNKCLGAMFERNYGVKKVILNMPDNCQYMSNTFANTSKLEEIVLNFSTKNIKGYEATFYVSTVKKIVGVLDFSAATSVFRMFNLCYYLEDVTFAPNTLSISLSLANSGNLTSESTQSIIDGLATVETAQTLTLSKAIVLTDEQKATINAKGWTLAQ